MSRHQKHPYHCAHAMGYCGHCDVAYCSKCSREWGRPCNGIHYYPNWTTTAWGSAGVSSDTAPVAMNHADHAGASS